MKRFSILIRSSVTYIYRLDGFNKKWSLFVNDTANQAKVFSAGNWSLSALMDSICFAIGALFGNALVNQS